jgi:heme oxygenase (mycobilin-producing)
MITRLVKMTFEPEKSKDFRLLFEQIKFKIAGFEGCHHLQLLNDKHLPNVFFTYSIWKDEIALENYRNSDLFAETWKKTKSLFAEKAQAWTTINEFDSAK